MALINNRKTNIEAELGIWKKCGDFIAGERAVKKRDSASPLNSTYLIPFDTAMSKEQFALYQREAEIAGVSNTVHKALSGALLRRSPTLLLPPEAAWVEDSLGVRGQGLVPFLNEMLHSQLITGNDLILVDYPNIEDGMSEAKRVELGIRPYPVIIPASNRLGEDTEFVNGSEKVKRVRYNKVESILNQSTQMYEDKVITIVLGLDDGGFYFISKYDEQGNKVGEDLYPQRFGTNMDVIPVWPVSGTFEITPPPLEAIVNSENHLYNKVSRRNHSYLLTNTVTITTAGVTKPSELGGLGGRWDLGAADATAGALTMPSELASNAKLVIDEAYLNLAGLGARMFANEGAGVETAEALSIKNQASHSVLASLATNTSSVFRNVLQFIIEWDLNKEIDSETVEFEMSKDFIPTKLNGQDLTALVQAYLQGMIPVSVFFHNLQTGELVPDAMTLEEFVEQKDDEMEVLADNTTQPVIPDPNSP